MQSFSVTAAAGAMVALLYCCFGTSVKGREESFWSRSSINSNMTVVISNFSTNSSDFMRDLLESMGGREALEDAHEEGQPLPSIHRRPQQHGPTPILSMHVSAMGSDSNSTSALLEAGGSEPSHTNKQRLPVKGAPVHVLAAAAAQLGLQSHQNATSSARPQLTQSSIDEGLTSWGAHQCAAFKAQWLEAAATN